MGGEYVCDTETNGLLDTLTKIHCLVGIDTSSEQVYSYNPNDITSGLDFVESADHLIFHNGINFDVEALKIVKPDIKLPKVTDTLIMSRMIYPDMLDTDNKMLKSNPNYRLPKKLFGRHSLESWGYRLGDYKGDFDGGDWQTYSQEMLDYCEQDCWVLLKLYRHLMSKQFSKQAMRLEHQFATIIQRQQRRGWAFNEQAASELYSQLVAKRQDIKDTMASMFPGWWETMKTPVDYKALGLSAATKTKLRERIKRLQPHRTLKEIDGLIKPGELKKKHTPFNPGSRPHIYKVFNEKYKWKPKVFTKGGEPKVDEDVLSSLEYPEAAILSQYFLLDKRIGQIAEGNQAWLRLVKNGRIHGSVNTLGAVTGRCTHSHPNIAQVPAKGVPYGKECRALFKASKGMVLVGADASGLELRCLAHYMAHWDKGEYAKVILEGDIHTVNQQAAGLPTRDASKTMIYGYLYGCGDPLLGTFVGGGREAGKALRFRLEKNLPALGNLVKMVKAAAKKGYIKGLDGRTLKVRSEHSALNVLLQSAGAIVMKYALVEADRLIQAAGFIPGVDYEFVGNIHDEIQSETLPENAEEIGKLLVAGIEAATTYYSFNCPLTGEYKVGDSWEMTH